MMSGEDLQTFTEEDFIELYSTSFNQEEITDEDYAFKLEIHEDTQYAEIPKTNINPNPFKGKTPEQIDEMFKEKGFETRGVDPVHGKGGYVNRDAFGETSNLAKRRFFLN